MSSPKRGNITSIAVPQKVKDNITREERMEDDTEMVIRLIKEKTNIEFDKREVMACHPYGSRDKTTCIIRIVNRKPGSIWDALTSAMRTGENMVKEVNVFMNYQLTFSRSALAKEVRKAKNKKKIDKYSVDQNGRIKVKPKTGDNRTFTEVKNLDDLAKLSS